MEGRQRRTPGAQAEGRGQIPCIRTDHIGRPAFATTLAGTVVWSVSYLPFGEVHVATGAPIDLRFPGQWFQAESGLYQNWMRDYDPTTGRYLEADPLGLVDGASVYGYARQNPGRWTDPRGEESEVVTGAISIGLGLAAADGPIPAGDVIGLCIVGAAITYCSLNQNACMISDENDCEAARDFCINYCTAKWMENTKGPVPRRADRFSRCISECMLAHGCAGTDWGGQYYP